MPSALAVLWNLIRDNKTEGKYQAIAKIDEVFALDLLKKEKQEIPKEILKLVDEREKARKEKNWKKADEIREKIKGKGWQVEDAEVGVKIKKI